MQVSKAKDTLIALGKWLYKRRPDPSRVRDLYTSKPARPCLEFIGTNWEDESSQLPVAILW